MQPSCTAQLLPPLQAASPPPSPQVCAAAETAPATPATLSQSRTILESCTLHIISYTNVLPYLAAQEVTCDGQLVAGSARKCLLMQ